MFFWCPFLDPHLTYHSSTGVQIIAMMELGTSTSLISKSIIILPLRILPIRFRSRGSRIHFKHKTHLQDNDVHNCTKSNTSCRSQIHQLRMSFPPHPIPWHTSTWGMQDRCNVFDQVFLWLLSLIRHLYLIEVWLGEYQRIHIKETYI
jgi:hypothetical protein